jgi:hypothetical protein
MEEANGDFFLQRSRITVGSFSTLALLKPGAMDHTRTNAFPEAEHEPEGVKVPGKQFPVG